jgi:hypothetical protein
VVALTRATVCTRYLCLSHKHVSCVALHVCSDVTDSWPPPCLHLASDMGTAAALVWLCGPATTQCLGCWRRQPLIGYSCWWLSRRHERLLWKVAWQWSAAFWSQFRESYCIEANNNTKIRDNMYVNAHQNFQYSCTKQTVFKQERQCTYNAILRRVRVSTFVVEKHYYILSVCL